MVSKYLAKEAKYNSSKKKKQKKLRHTGNQFRKNLQLKDAC